MSIAVETVTTSAALAALGPMWDELVSRAALTHPFVTHEWIQTWWESYGAGAELRVLIVRADGKPIAIAPLMRTTERVYGKLSRCLRMLANDHTPRCEFVVVAERADQAYAAIWNYLMSGSDDWDVLQLREVPADSSTAHELKRLATSSATLSGSRQSTPSPYLPITTAWQPYIAGLPKKRRWFLRTWLKRLGEVGDVALETVTGEPNLHEALRDGFRLESSTWKDDAGTAIRQEPDSSRFYTVLAERAAAKGWLRLHFLNVGGRRIAFEYCLAYQGRTFLLKTGFDPEYAAYSPGTLLCYLALQDTFESGFTAYDFLGNDDFWKRQWTSQSTSHEWLFFYANRPWSKVAHYTKFTVIPALQRIPLYVRLRDHVFGATS